MLTAHPPALVANNPANIIGESLEENTSDQPGADQR